MIPVKTRTYFWITADINISIPTKLSVFAGSRKLGNWVNLKRKSKLPQGHMLY